MLVRKTPGAYIDITVDMDEFDLTASKPKATYQEIKDYTKGKYDVKVSSLDMLHTIDYYKPYSKGGNYNPLYNNRKPRTAADCAVFK